MCGIAGSINCKLTADELNAIKHRGPDHQELVEFDMGSNKIFFGHTRLAIIDLSKNGNQPMFSKCGNYGIIFNGEVYNHLELRKKLTGVSFNGNSDTETILYYLKEFGIDSVKDFNGIFALAFVDKVSEKVFLVRDHFGIKPLYYYSKGKSLIFGSEMKIIKNNPIYEKEIDTEALNTFLSFRYNPAPYTLFKGIKKLEAANYLVYHSSGEITQVNYWQKEQKINFKIDENEAIAEYQFLLEQAVKRQLLSDVPVGLLLSGGLDSAVIGKIMSENISTPIQTFTVGFQGKGNFNELDDARNTSEFIGSKHNEIFMDQQQYMDYFHKSFFHTEEPIAEPTIPALYYVSNLASKHVKVVLSGQGADEPMAGYKRYRGEKLLSDYSSILSLLPISLTRALFPTNSAIERGVYSSQFKNELDRFIGIYTLFTPDLKRELYQQNIAPLIDTSQRKHFEHHYLRTDPNADSLSKMLYLDTRGLLPDNLLIFNDKMTMANSIENRVPYLDVDLINFIESLPIHLKLRGKVGKYIHRKASEKWVPNSIIDRKKRGFETPVGEWFKEELSGTLIDLINSNTSFSKQYFNVAAINKMIDLHTRKKRDYRRNLFMILSLELWYKNFYLA
ncbi:MAG: asparagine synthase (glutamine-hydrolyzing) [Pedobacter sp.]|nr:MAG: asparagine synthase (glutamine-hydrolyzing) [Pedobacter sp.]